MVLLVISLLFHLATTPPFLMLNERAVVLNQVEVVYKECLKKWLHC